MSCHVGRFGRERGATTQRYKIRSSNSSGIELNVVEEAMDVDELNVWAMWWYEEKVVYNLSCIRGINFFWIGRCNVPRSSLS